MHVSRNREKDIGTVKFLSEALIFAEHRVNMLCTEIVLNVKNNLDFTLLFIQDILFNF